MKLIEQAEHELRLLMLIKPSTARALIERIAALELEKERIDNHNVLQAMRIAALEAAIEKHREQQYGTCKRPLYRDTDTALYAALKTDGK